MTEKQELLLECFIRCGYDEELALRAYNFIISYNLDMHCDDSISLDVESTGTLTTTGVRLKEDYNNITKVKANDED